MSSNKVTATRKLIRGTVVILGIAGFTYGFQQWGSHAPERLLYNVKSSIKLNSVKDEVRMAYVCYKLEKLNCKFDALAKAYKKDPQNEKIVGEFAIALSEINQDDKAILTFQKYYSVAEGTSRHHAQYAKSLAAKEYYADSKEWYYKAIKSNPNNLDIVENMVDMLRKSYQFGEALSVIGHYELTMPHTRKHFAQLHDKVKGEYKSYQEQYAIKEMTVSKLGQYFFAPVIIQGSLDSQLFIVNPDSVYTTVDLKYLQSNNIPFQDKGAIKVNATNGTELTGTRVNIPSLVFGAFQLENVEAIACDNCAFVAGKSILNRLSTTTTQVANTQVGLLSMKQK